MGVFFSRVNLGVDVLCIFCCFKFYGKAITRRLKNR